MAGTGMSRAALDAFLAQPWIARLGCLDQTGAPYVVPTWYEWDGGAFWLVPRARSAWATFLQRDPRVCLCIDEEGGGHRRAQVRGLAEVVETPNVGGQVGGGGRAPGRALSWTRRGGRSTWCRRSTGRGG